MVGPLPCFARFHRDQRSVPGRKPVTDWLTTNDSTLDCCQFEQMAGATVNVSSSGYYNQTPVGHLGHCLDKGLSDADGDSPWGSCVSISLLPRRVFNSGRIFFITTIVMALQAIFPRVDATLAQLRELGEAVQIITGRKGAVCDFIMRTLAVRGKKCCSFQDHGQIKRTEKRDGFFVVLLGYKYKTSLLEPPNSLWLQAALVFATASRMRNSQYLFRMVSCV